MQNEYGEKLDRNGYAPSIVQAGTEEYPDCYLCGEYIPCEHLDRHEIFGGVYREKSKRLGLWVLLHHNICHENGPAAAHQNRDTMLMLKQAGQKAAMEHYGWSVEDFIREFGRNYLD